MASERWRRRLLGALLIGVTGLAAPSVARADPTQAEKESARNHMQQGDALKDKGDKEAALKSYEAADAIMHVPTTGIEVARMQTALGLLLEARDTLARIAKLPAKPNEPPPFVAARKAATELANDVNARIPSLAVTVTNPEAAQSVTATIDNETVTPGAEPKKLNPGKHVVTARAGAVEKREEITLAEREQKTVTLDLRPPPPSPPPEPPPNEIAKPLVYGGFALAIVGVGVGSATGLMSIARVNDVKPQCEGGTRCPPSTASDIDSAKTLGTISTVAFIAGGVGVALGVTGLLMNKSRSDATTAKVVEPMIGPTWAGVRGAF